VFGRLQVDGGGLGDDDDFYKNDNATELRAARLGIEGNFYDWKYKFEPDFGLGEVDVKDAYIEYDGEFVEPAYVRISQYKVPNSLEWLTNRLFIKFMERAAIVDAFGLTRQIGLGSGVSGENWGVDAGLFGQNASDQDNNEGYALAGRGHYAFLYGPEDSGSAVHLGASARYRNFDNDTLTARSGTNSGHSFTLPARAAWIPGRSTTPKATFGSGRSSPGSRGRSHYRASSRTRSCSASTARMTPTTCGAAISAPATS
jgi:phosphate-selective porin OprO/OprP